MLNYQIIESKENQRIKDAVRLAKESKFRKVEQKAIIYGEHLIKEAVQNNVVEHVFVLSDKLTKYEDLLQRSEIKIFLLSIELMHKINLLDSEIEIAAVVNIPRVDDFDLSKDCIILENIQDPGNLGTILRVANASGISQVVVSRGSVDVYNPKVLRASQGIQFSLSIYSDIDVIELVQKFNGNIIALTPHAEESIYNVNLQNCTAMVFGNEGNGLSNDLLSLIKEKVKIPMMGNTESINLAMAATVVAFEMSRQRIKG